ncbi:unnamed protein product [Rotaria sordida]|uniref:FAD-binding domain-containing protein n=2 Tax=Rotaria sordida TaxID=392033 RepID=A0A819LI08_9BILA|nr:unnamed protein product [Rotaria sordida]
MTQASNETKTILIIGGGLDGLALSQLLLQDSPPSLKVIVFERDAEEDTRDQGYYITINSMGIDVLKRISVLNDVLSDSTTMSYSQCQLKFADKKLNTTLTTIAGELKIIERAVLRRNLLKNIDVRWNKRFISYNIVDHGIEAHFDDGSSVKGTLLVGCDGSKSVVRAQLVPNLCRQDTGVVLVAGTLEPNEQLGQIQQLIENSLVQVLGDQSHALFLISVGQYWFWSLSWATEHTMESSLSPEELLDKVRTNFNNEEIVRLIELSLSSASLIPLRLYSSPLLKVNPFPNNFRVTLIGDAAHLMTIQRGMGANTTFADGLDLADVIRHGSTQSLLGDYEEKMFKRGFQAVQDSFNSTRMMRLSGIHDREQGGYNVSVADHVWLRSSYTSLYADERWYSSNDGSLPLIDTRLDHGYDENLGEWNETQLIYSLTRNGIQTNVTGRARQWSSISAITFHLDIGNESLTSSDSLSMDEVRTVFPSFNIERIDMNGQRGYFTYADFMMGDMGKHAGIWNSSSKIIQSGIKAGPIVLFNLTERAQGDVLILSPFSRFMATSLSQRANVLEFGVMGSMSVVPSNYNHSMIVFYSSHGVNEAMREWGQSMRRAFNRTMEHRLNDITINYLGYYTDNGGYYYYHTETEMNYEETIISISQKISLPFRYIQIDSWWYYKGIGGGVSEWSSRPDIFPDGLPAVHRQMKYIPLAAHNRYWAADTIYSKNYAFVIDHVNGKALPISNDSFWIDLFDEASQNWGLILYEQDWLNVQTIDFIPTRTDIHLGQRWLTSMGKAAEQIGLNIQYCMSLPRHALQALEIPRVTQARVSNDYVVHLRQQDSQWTIGVSSMLADAIGLAPYKDVFWSNSIEPGAPYKEPVMEPVPDREILIATLPTGPVASGDAINYTDVKRIMRCCNEDGTILKPDRPITMIDALVADWAQNNGVSQGELYSTLSMLNNQTFHIIFASAMRRDYSVLPSMIGAQAGLIWFYDDPSTLTTFDETYPLAISANKCNDSSFCLWYLSPVWSFADPNNTQYALLESNP